MSSPLASLLVRIQPAGVILFARNIINAQQTHKCSRLQALVREPLFACVDLEGGSVDRFRNVTGPAPSAADVFATRDPGCFAKHGQNHRRTCAALGFNLDFRPRNRPGLLKLRAG